MVRLSKIGEHALRGAFGGALTAGLTQFVARAGFRCVVTSVARGALVGAAGGAVSIAFTGWALATVANSLYRTIVEDKLLKSAC